MNHINKNLIYIEDDRVLAEVTVRAMNRRGFNTTHYSEMALAKKDTARNFYSHALLDLRLPDGNALPLVSELASRHRNIKIVVLTGFASIATAVQAVKQGAVNYLAKPVTAEQITHAFDEDVYHNSAAQQLEQMSLKRMEWELIQQALDDNHGNISATARQLKMHRRTLQRKLAKKPSHI